MPIPGSSGYGNKKINAGKMESKGIELMVNATPFQNKDWRVGVYFNIAHNENKITEMPETGVKTQPVTSV